MNTRLLRPDDETASAPWMSALVKPEALRALPPLAGNEERDRSVTSSGLTLGTYLAFAV